MINVRDEKVKGERSVAHSLFTIAYCPFTKNNIMAKSAKKSAANPAKKAAKKEKLKAGRSCKKIITPLTTCITDKRNGCRERGGKYYP